MSNIILQGKVAFVNHEKKYVMIEYEANSKKKTINGSVDDKMQAEWIAKRVIKRKHQFHIGDSVSFIARLSDRGDKMIATNIEYLYNTTLDVLLNKARTVNKFSGYLKVIDDKYFVKEIESYLFFPVPIAPWQIKPEVEEDGEAVFFSLENIEKKDKVTARLFNNDYIPEFYTLIKHQKNKTPIIAKVFNITAHGVYVYLISDQLKAKLPVLENEQLAIGDTLEVQVIHISDKRIVINRV